MNQIATDGAEAMGETGEGGKKKSWYEALSDALGKVLDAQAEKIQGLSDKVSGMSGDDSDKPSVMTELQSASQKMSFLMSAANDVLKTIGQALAKWRASNNLSKRRFGRALRRRPRRKRALGSAWARTRRL